MNVLSAFVLPIKREHPEEWAAIRSRRLAGDEIFEVNAWLRGMTKSDYDIVGDCFGPNKIIVYFQSCADAVWFKLAWGGEE